MAGRAPVANTTHFLAMVEGMLIRPPRRARRIAVTGFLMVAAAENITTVKIACSQNEELGNG